MLGNTRGRTVFSCQPKRLPDDIDKLSLYKGNNGGTIVRKRSLNRLDVGSACAGSPTAEDASPKGSPTKSHAAADGSIPGDLSARSGRPPLGLRRSASTPLVSPCGSARGPGGRPPPPPPLPSFPSGWKAEPCVALKPVSARSQLAAALEESRTQTGGPALRPRPKPLRERAPDVLEKNIGSESLENPLSPNAMAGQASSSSAASGVTTPSALQRSPSTPNPHRPPAAPERRRPRPKTADLHEVISSPPNRCQAPSAGSSPYPAQSSSSSTAHRRPAPTLGSSPYPSDFSCGSPPRACQLPLAPATVSPQAADAAYSGTPPQQVSPQAAGDGSSPSRSKRRPEAVVTPLALVSSDADPALGHSPARSEQPASPAAAAGQALLLAALSPTACGSGVVA